MRWLGWITCVWILAFTEAAAQPAQFAYRISFTDKKGAPAPSLSARSLQRRYAQGITLDTTDRPVSPAYLDSVLTLTGGVLHNTSRWLNQCVILLSDSTDIHQITGRPFARSAEYVGYFAAGLHMKPPGNPGPSAGRGKARVPVGGLKTTGTAAFYGAGYGQSGI